MASLFNANALHSTPFASSSSAGSKESHQFCRESTKWRQRSFSGARRVLCTLQTDTSQEVMNLGRTPLQVSKLGIGTLQWGDPGSGFGEKYGEEELGSAFDELIKGGINYFDSAEVYGYQGIKSGTSAEQLLGRFVTRPSAQGGGLPPVISSKFFTIPWSNFLVGGGFRLGRKSLLAALKESLKRLGKNQIDLYQIHFPFPTFSNAALMESLKEAVEEGLTKAVGVSNYSKDQMEEADDILAKYGIPLASNQVQFSLLCQKPVEEGLLQAAQDREITLIAYSPLASGLLTAKTLGKTDNKSKQLQPLLELLQEVALNYLITKGALPTVGVKNSAQGKEHTETLGWRLTDSEVAELEEKRRYLKL